MQLLHDMFPFMNLADAFISAFKLYILLSVSVFHRDGTNDLCVAKAKLYQLSYTSYYVHVYCITSNW